MLTTLRYMPTNAYYRMIHSAAFTATPRKPQNAALRPMQLSPAILLAIPILLPLQLSKCTMVTMAISMGYTTTSCSQWGKAEQHTAHWCCQ